MMSIFLSKRFIKLLDLELEINFCSLTELIVKLELDKLNGKEDSLETTFESTRMVCLRSTGSRYESLSAFCYNRFFPGAVLNNTNIIVEIKHYFIMRKYF